MKKGRLVPSVLGGAAKTPFASKIASYSPFLWWKMNESSGTTITDYGSGSHNGTLTLGSGSLGATGIGDGGTSITFSASAATSIAVSGNPSLSLPAAGTIAFWWKKADGSIWTDNTSRLTRFDRADNANYIRLEKDTGNVLRMFYRAGGGTAINIAITPNTTTDWFLFAGTWDGTGTAVYQILKGGTTGAKNEAGGTSGTWSAGGALWQMPGATTYVGDFCHMMILSTKLTEAQLQDLANL